MNVRELGFPHSQATPDSLSGKALTDLRETLTPAADQRLYLE
ncbi:MAG: hypothetical protein ABI229_11300 [Gemmatimonadaceae bacterium]